MFKPLRLVSLRGLMVAAAVLLATGPTPLALINFAHAANTYVTLNSFNGHPGVVLSVNGGGFTPSETVNLTETIGGSVVASASAAANTNGEFPATSLTVPVNAPQGSATITATGATSALSATNAYYVEPFTPSISASAASNTPGSTVLLTGSGFAPSEGIALTFATATGVTTADAMGNFTATALTIPVLTPGVVMPQATGSQSGASAITYFYVGGFFPSIYPSGYYLLPKQVLQFNGSGYQAGETVNVLEGMNTTPLTLLTANAMGNFALAGDITIPTTWAGTSRTFHLVGASSHASSDATVTIGQYFPNVYPTAYYILPGNSLGFSGSGFVPGESVSVYAGLDTTPLSTFTTDAFGAFLSAGTTSIPEDAGGKTLSFRLVGADSGAQSIVSLTVGQLYPQLSPSDYYLKPLQKFSATGTGFSANEDVDLLIGTTHYTATADAMGTASFTGLVMPKSTLPSLTFTATGAKSKAVASVDVSVGSYFAFAGADQYYIQPGSTVTITGSGFAPGEDVTVALGNITTTVSADKNGDTAPAALVVPFGLKDGTVTLTGVTSGATATVALTIAPFNAQISLDTYYAQPGTVVTASGSGFVPGETVTATLGSATATMKASAMGTVAIPLTIPFGLVDTTVILTGSTSAAVASTALTLAPFSPSVSPSTWYGTPGSAVSFDGTGFVPGETVNVSKGLSALTTVAADTMGAFHLTGQTLPFGATSVAYTFTGALSGANQTINIGLSGFYPGVSLDGYYGFGGSPLTVSGSGFAPGEGVQVMVGSVALPTQTASAMGTFSVATTVPFVAPGSLAVTATGAISGASASTSYTVASLPSMNLQMQSYAGPAGSDVTFIGTGFLPNEPITVTSDRGGVNFSFSADASGAFSAGGTLPAGLASGNLTFTVTGQHSMSPATIVFYVTQ